MTKEIVSIEVTDETVSDGEKFSSLVHQAETNLTDAKIDEVLADGGYDHRDNFNHLHEKGIRPIIRTRADSLTKTRGSPLRARAVRKMRDVGYRGRKEKTGMAEDGRWRLRSQPSKE